MLFPLCFENIHNNRSTLNAAGQKLAVGLSRLALKALRKSVCLAEGATCFAKVLSDLYFKRRQPSRITGDINDPQ